MIKFLINNSISAYETNYLHNYRINVFLSLGSCQIISTFKISSNLLHFLHPHTNADSILIFSCTLFCTSYCFAYIISIL